MVHNYKLKLTVGNTEYLADINWTTALDSIFNKRCRRINDRGSSPYYSTHNTLSGYLTGGVAIANADVPLIPKQSFLWTGKRKNGNTEYTYNDYTGTVGKVALVPEIIPDNPDKTFYTMTLENMIEEAGSNVNTLPGEGLIERFRAISYAKNNVDILFTNQGVISTNNKIIAVNLPKTKWGLDGIQYDSMASRSFQTDYRVTGTMNISDNCIHNYTYNTDELEQLFDVDEQTESQTISGETITYKTWNCLFYLRNDYYGTTKGDSFAQNDDYIFINEYLAAKVIRIGQYNNPNFPYADYPFKPANCDIFLNMTTGKLEGLSNSQSFDGILNYQVFNKETYEEEAIGTAEISNITQLDLTQLDYTDMSPTSPDHLICIDEDNFVSESYIVNGKYPFRMFDVFADSEKVYLAGGYASNNTDIYSYDIEDILQSPSVITITNESISDITSFLNTNYRDTLYKIPSYPLVSGADIGYLINKDNAIVNEWGYLKWICSGVADFGNVQIQSGDTFKFELVETITAN